MNIRSQTCPKKAFARTNHRFLLPSKLCNPSLAIPEEGYYLSRNIPHPKRVHHIKGLNDVPICYVRNEEYFPARLDHEIARFLNPDKEYLFQQASSGKNTITVHSHNLHESNGLPPLTEHWKLWKQGLSCYIEKTRFPKIMKTRKKEEDSSKRTIAPFLKPASYSPPVSCAQCERFPLCCSLSRKNPPDGATCLDYELNVMSKLCQILQTDSLLNVQNWMLTASSKEKQYLLDIICRALTSELSDNQQDGANKDIKENLLHQDARNAAHPSSAKDVAQTRLSNRTPESKKGKLQGKLDNLKGSRNMMKIECDAIDSLKAVRHPRRPSPKTQAQPHSPVMSAKKKVCVPSGKIPTPGTK